ncbi:glycoside hydrolase family 2 TIM barrel-domain containing protein [Rathayibacter sp. Leaf248]|uniref:glycoside hydrolase family 2 TIM barrel-domain containing protein n=1 Tax=Rathayibacter sp. Leaf248 TaxID=2876555 RepID=UPI001E4A6357|nr:glycoside hydrolase family 2 TIM barrel-domain containing protein [Rathayibacter sp. Leaf248]
MSLAHDPRPPAASSPGFDPSRLSDPGYFAENRRPAHSDHRWFRSVDEAATGVSSFEQSLNGRWRIHYSPDLAGTVPGFEQPDFDAGDWDTIPVPAHIQLHGYDRPQYVNTQYPWDGHEDLAPGQAPQRFNPVASYRTVFTLDAPPAPGERIALDVRGAESAIALWLNGRWLGFSADSFSPAEFDLTDLLVEGENVLAAQVVKWGAGSWLEDQDFFRFSGIFRDVVLLRRPRTHLEDLRVTTVVGDSWAEIAVEPSLDGDGSVVVELEGVGVLRQDEDGRHRLRLADPRLWSPEDPHLHRLIVRVRDAEGAETEVVPQSVGLRRFGIEDGVLRLNGRRIVFFGVNRHEFGVDGRVVTREQTEEDLRILKRAGVNAIRTSHYPNNSYFYELADEYGFLVIDEMNLETHGVWDRVRYLDAPLEEAVPGDDSRWAAALADRARSLVERDKNHPSVVMWSLGNESFGGSVLRDLSDWFREVDDRPVHYEGVHWDSRYPDTTDVVSQMYTPAAEVEEYLREHRDKPFILCEYAHAMGNSFGAVDRYLDLAAREPLFQGGFIWDFADQAIAMVDRHGVPYFGYGGDNGEAPHDGDFSGNGILFADRTPTPKLQEVAFLYQPFRIDVSEEGIAIENRLLSTPSSAFDAVVTLRREGRVLAEQPLETAVQPGGRATFASPVPVPELPGEYTLDVELRLASSTRWAEAGHVVASGQRVLEVVGRPHVESRPRPEVVEGTHNVGVRGEGFSVLFSRLHGGLQSYRWGGGAEGGRELLDSMPMPSFWHAPTSNERGWGGPFEDGQWLLASRYARAAGGALRTARVSSDDSAVTVGYTYELPTTPRAFCDVDYRVTGDGRIEVTVAMDVPDGLPDLPEFGMQWTTSADAHRLRWYGDGPDECYSDRRLGARLDVWSSDVGRELTPYLKPQEAGSRTGVRWAEVTGDDGWGLRLDCDGGMEFSALHWTPFEIENAQHPNELPPVQRTVLRPALRRRGVAGDDSWGARTHPEYLVRPRDGRLVFRFGVSGVSGS